MSSQEFFSPKMTGKRFEDHSIPVDFLEDFIPYEQLLKRVAKEVYYEENGRQRVPKGFGNDISLKLAKIEEGSSLAKFMLVASTFLVQGEDTFHYFEKAQERIVKCIDAVQKDEPANDYLPPKFFGYFNRIGKNLRSDESIDFIPGSTRYNAKLTPSNRIKLAFLSPKVYFVNGVASVRGVVSAADKIARNFKVLTKDQTQFVIKLESEFSEIVFDAFNKFEDNVRVLISGMGSFDRQAKLHSIDSVSSITILHHLDVPSRLDDLLSLEPGWLDGDGFAYSKEHIDWLTDQFERYISPELLLPYTYPTIEGGIQFEWKVQEHDTTLDINLVSKNGYYHYLNVATNVDADQEFDLNNEQAWNSLNDTLLRFYKK